MSTELELAAATAWAKLSRKHNVFDCITGAEAMPIPVAIDYAQNPTGDRDDAVSALMVAAANMLHALRADIMDVNGIMREAEAVESCIRGESFALARSERDVVHHRAEGSAQDILAGIWQNAAKGSVSACDLWRLWAIEAERVILLCEQIVREAYPVEL